MMTRIGRHMRRISVVIVVLLAASVVAARCSRQPPPAPPTPDTPTPVTWSIEAAPDSRPAAGGTVNVLLIAKVTSGWHMYAMSQIAGGPSALRITVLKDQPFTLSGSVIEPASKKAFDQSFNVETQFFDADTTLTVPVLVAFRTAAGPRKLNVDVEFQACNERLCHPPEKVSLATDIVVRPAASRP